jgi:hypothetical protein
MSENVQDLKRLLDSFRKAQSRLLSTKDIKEIVGRDWRDAVAKLMTQGYALEQIAGSSGNVSYRLAKDELPLPSDRAAPITITRYPDPLDPVQTVRLKLSHIKGLLRMGVEPEVRDALVAAVVRYEEGYRR